MYRYFPILFEDLPMLAFPTITNTYGSPFFQSCTKDVSFHMVLGSDCLRMKPSPQLWKQSLRRGCDALCAVS